jgi:hypothetical protein
VLDLLIQFLSLVVLPVEVGVVAVEALQSVQVRLGDRADDVRQLYYHHLLRPTPLPLPRLLHPQPTGHLLVSCPADLQPLLEDGVEQLVLLVDGLLELVDEGTLLLDGLDAL